MQARFYDPVMGRFLSPFAGPSIHWIDGCPGSPVGFAQSGVGYFNRYAYVQNDPINAIDPTGMEILENNRPLDAVVETADNAIEGTQYEGDADARAELIGDAMGSLEGMSAKASIHAGNGYGSGTYVGGVKETGIGAEIVEAFGGERNEFATVPSNIQPANGALQPPGQNVWGAGAQDTMVTTIISQDQAFTTAAFANHVDNVTATAQKLANSTGSPIAMTVRNSNPRQSAARHFAITPDERR